MTVASDWAEAVAKRVAQLCTSTGHDWIMAEDYAYAATSVSQARHILKRATEYGALERRRDGNRFLYRAAAA